MKNMTRWIAMLLAFVMVLGLGLSAASADTCYEILKMAFEDEENDVFTYLGKGQEFEPEVDTDVVYFIANATSGHVGITGLNTLGQPEGYCWLDVSNTDALLAFADFCQCYELLCGYLDDCDALVGGIYLSEDGDPIIVNDAASADTFVEVLKQWAAEE